MRKRIVPPRLHGVKTRAERSPSQKLSIERSKEGALLCCDRVMNSSGLSWRCSVCGRKTVKHRKRTVINNYTRIPSEADARSLGLYDGENGIAKHHPERWNNPLELKAYEEGYELGRKKRKKTIRRLDD